MRPAIAGVARLLILLEFVTTVYYITLKLFEKL